MDTLWVTCGNSTDVFNWAGNYGPSSLHGRWDCAYTNSAGECESGDLLLNRESLDGEGQNAKNHTACHENGHSIALDHELDDTRASCTHQGLDEPWWFSDHDKNHVSGRY